MLADVVRLDYVRMFHQNSQEVPVSTLRFQRRQEAWGSCTVRFYPLSFEEAERLAPELRQCYVSKWAFAVQRTLAISPCTSLTAEDAQLVVLPGYAAIALSILAVLMPTAVALKWRGDDQSSSPYQVTGGQLSLVAAFIAGLLIIFFKIT